MTDFLLYIARSGLYLGIFHAFFLLAMRKTTFFRTNRILLLAGSLGCLLLPLFHLRTRTLPPAAGTGETLAQMTTAAAGLNTAADGGFSWTGLLAALFFAGMAAVALNIFASGWKLRKIRKSGTRRTIGGSTAIVTDAGLPSFNFGRLIFIDRSELENDPAIFTHEQMHVRCRHYLDVFFFAGLSMLYWWNPLVWITRTELNLLHEYEADEGVLKQGVEARQYQLLLVRKAVGNERFLMASGFRQAKLKNRIAMMRQEASPVWKRWVGLAVIPVLAAAAYACNPVLTQDAEEDVIAVTLADSKPTFNGGNANELSRWVNQHLHYPEEALAAGIQGRTLLTLIVEKDGSMSGIRVLRGVHPTLDEEAVRVLESCPIKWTPAWKDGRPVRVSYLYPISFELR